MGLRQVGPDPHARRDACQSGRLLQRSEHPRCIDVQCLDWHRGAHDQTGERQQFKRARQGNGDRWPGMRQFLVGFFRVHGSGTAGESREGSATHNGNVLEAVRACYSAAGRRAALPKVGMLSGTLTAGPDSNTSATDRERCGPPQIPACRRVLPQAWIPPLSSLERPQSLAM